MNAKIRTTIIALVAASGFAATSVVPAVSQARPVKVYPTSATAGMLQNARCTRWENRINEDKSFPNVRTKKQLKEDENKAMDAGCFIIY